MTLVAASDTTPDRLSKILHPIQHPIAADLISECEMDTRYTSTESDDHIDVKIQLRVGGRGRSLFNVRKLLQNMPPGVKRLAKAMARLTVGKLPPPATRLTGPLATDGGTPVRDTRFGPGRVILRKV